MKRTDKVRLIKLAGQMEVLNKKALAIVEQHRLNKAAESEIRDRGQKVRKEIDGVWAEIAALAGPKVSMFILGM